MYGQNGSGKSTFIDLITGAKAFQKGQIEINANEPLFSVVFQDSFFDEKTVINQLIFLNKANSFACDINKVLNDYELENVAMLKFKELSFGQKQRLRFAVALIKPFSILILDEVLTGIDKRFKTIIKKILKKLSI
nr:ATP-binding cassette domain-containing protein [Williamsoniiplasma somnilux]